MSKSPFCFTTRLGLFMLLVHAPSVTRSDDCADVLTKDVKISSLTNAESLAYLNLVTEDNYTKHSTDVSAGGGIGSISGHADFNKLDEDRRDFCKRIGFNFSAQESQSILVSKLSGTAIKAWRDCKLGGNIPGIKAALLSFDNDTVSVAFCWRPPAKGRAEKVGGSQLSGAIAPGAPPGCLFKDGFEFAVNETHSLLLQRKKDQPTKLILNVGGTSAELTVPWTGPPKPIAPPTKEEVFRAVSDGNVIYVAYLIDCGFNVNRIIVDDIGDRPLHLAADRCYPDMVRMLLNKGADPGIRNAKYKNTALDVAITHCGADSECVKILREAASK